jgi:hypothetical protein
MDDLESKLGSMLSNPELMQQVMSLAQSLGQAQGSPPSEPHPQAPLPASGNPLGDLNPAMLTQIAGIASKTSVDQNQRRLLSALSPYLPGNRIQKLEKAMRAAKLARFASEALNQGKTQNQSGR